MNDNTDGVSAMSTELGHDPERALWGAMGCIADDEACLTMLRAHVAASVAAERERCIRIVETYQVPVGNSAAGEMDAEWTMQALREVRDEIGLPNTGYTTPHVV